MKSTTLICLALSAAALAVCAVTPSAAEIAEAQALQRSIMLSELLSGQKIPLNYPQFYGYAQVCLVGYDLIGEPLQRCKGSKENTVLAVPVSNASCMEFVGPEDLKGRKLNVLMGGEAYCKDFGSNNSLSIVQGWNDRTRDRIDLDVQ